MRASRLMLPAAAAALLGAWLAGCADDGPGKPPDTPYVLGFVSLTAPEAVAAGDTIPVTFELLMPDTCHRYDHCDRVQGAHRADLTLWGRISHDPCIQTTYTERAEIPLTGAAAGTYRIVVHLADRDSVVREVEVR